MIFSKPAQQCPAVERLYRKDVAQRKAHIGGYESQSSIIAGGKVQQWAAYQRKRSVGYDSGQNNDRTVYRTVGRHAYAERTYRYLADTGPAAAHDGDDVSQLVYTAAASPQKNSRSRHMMTSAAVMAKK